MKQKNGLSISKLSIIANKGIQTKASFCKQTRLKSKTKYLAFHTCLNNHLRIKHGHRKNLSGKACDLPCSPPEKVNNPLTNPVGTWFPTCNDIFPISDGKLFSIKKLINLAQKLTFSKTEPTFAVISRTGTVCSPIFIYHWTYSFVFYGIFMPRQMWLVEVCIRFLFAPLGLVGLYLPRGRIRVCQWSRRSFQLAEINKISLEWNIFTIGYLH